MADEPKQKEHVVKPGDRMSKIAHEHGYKDYHALYLAQSAELRKKRPNPEILMPGDVIVLPAKIEEKHGAKDKKKHTYEEDTLLPKLRAHLQIGGKPFAKKELEVKIETAPYSKQKPYLGKVTTDGDGVALFHVDPVVEQVILTCKSPALEVRLKVGHLRPVIEAGGVEQRMDNLGYRVPHEPPPTPEGSEARKKAEEAHARRISKEVKRFLEHRKSKGTGKLDDALRKLLVKVHEPPT